MSMPSAESEIPRVPLVLTDISIGRKKSSRALRHRILGTLGVSSVSVFSVYYSERLSRVPYDEQGTPAHLGLDQKKSVSALLSAYLLWAVRISEGTPATQLLEATPRARCTACSMAYQVDVCTTRRGTAGGRVGQGPSSWGKLGFSVWCRRFPHEFLLHLRHFLLVVHPQWQW